MMKRIFMRLVAFALTAAFCAAAFSAVETDTAQPMPISVDALGRTVLSLQEDGTFAKEEYTGEVERFRAIMSVSDLVEPGTAFTVTLSTKNMKPDPKSVRMLVYRSKELFAYPQKCSVGENILKFTLTVDGNTIKPGEECSVYFEAARTGGAVEATVKVEAKKEKELKEGNSIEVDGYTISKQGDGANALETAVGLSGMNDTATVYIVSRGGEEIVRVVLQDNAVLGMAKYDASRDMVVSLEYDLNSKTYINALTKKPMLSKEELLDVLNALGFSFLRAPDEQDWLARQYDFTSSKTVKLKKAD